MVLIPGLAANIELSWEQEVYRRAREHIGTYLSVVEFDKRGMGSSDKVVLFEPLHEKKPLMGAQLRTRTAGSVQWSVRSSNSG